MLPIGRAGIGGFNPQPATLPAASGRATTGRRRSCFNPQPATLPAARLEHYGCRDSASPVSILSRPRCRLQAVGASMEPSVLVQVSILSRPRCRLQADRGAVRGTARSGFNPQPATLPAASPTCRPPAPCQVWLFQSSAGHVAGCKTAPDRPAGDASDGFNPQPATLPAASTSRRTACASAESCFNPQPATLPAASAVAERHRITSDRCFNPQPATLPAASRIVTEDGSIAHVVSILSRPRCRLQVAVRVWRRSCPHGFQSSAGHVAGCKPPPRPRAVGRATSFNPQPATLPAASRAPVRDRVTRHTSVSILSRPRCRLQARGTRARRAVAARGFNPQPATLPAASRSSGIARRDQSCFNPQPATLPAAS